MSKTSVAYVTTAGYCPDAVNGFYGGIEPSGDIVVNFFMECYALPDREEIIRNKNGEVVDHKVFRANEIQRHVKSGIAVNVQTALMLRDWLNAQVEAVTAEIQRGTDNEKPEAGQEGESNAGSGKPEAEESFVPEGKTGNADA